MEKKLVSAFLEKKGFSVFGGAGEGADRIVDGCRVAIKMSTAWDNGGYRFQQFRKHDYEILICLGISPNTVHAWVVRKSDINWEEIEKQHGGKKGKGTWWISFIPSDCPHEWMRPHDGNLAEMAEELKRVIKSLKK